MFNSPAKVFTMPNRLNRKILRIGNKYVFPKGLVCAQALITSPQVLHTHQHCLLFWISWVQQFSIHLMCKLDETSGASPVAFQFWCIFVLLYPRPSEPRQLVLLWVGLIPLLYFSKVLEFAGFCCAHASWIDRL